MPVHLRVRVPIENDDGHLVGWVVYDDLDERVETADESGTLPVEFHLLWPGTAEQPTVKVSFRVRDGEPRVLRSECRRETRWARSDPR